MTECGAVNCATGGGGGAAEYRGAEEGIGALTVRCGPKVEAPSAEVLKAACKLEVDPEVTKTHRHDKRMRKRQRDNQTRTVEEKGTSVCHACSSSVELQGRRQNTGRDKCVWAGRSCCELRDLS